MSGVTSLNSITGVVACVSQNTGALSISGAGQSVLFQPLAGGVTEITAGGQVSSGALAFVDGTGITITNDGFNNLTFTGSGGGGNWSYKGVFVATSGTAYALNDVVFDTTNTSQTYVCILAYTTGAGASAPSADATHWKLFATNTASSASSITGGGATVTCGVPSGSGSINLTTSAIGLNGDVEIDTHLGANGNVTITTRKEFSVNTVTDGNAGVTLTTAGTNTIFGGFGGGLRYPDVIKMATNTPSQLVIGGASAPATGLWVGQSSLTFNGTAVGGSGGNWNYRGTWVTATTYAVNDVVFDTINTNQTYVCIGVVTSPFPPSVLLSNWRLFSTNNVGGQFVTQSGTDLAGITYDTGLTFPSTTPTTNLTLVTFNPPISLTNPNWYGGMTSTWYGTVSLTIGLTVGGLTGGTLNWTGLRLVSDGSFPGAILGIYNFPAQIPLINTGPVGGVTVTSPYCSLTVSIPTGTASVPRPTQLALQAIITNGSDNWLIEPLTGFAHALQSATTAIIQNAVYTGTAVALG